MKKDWKVTLSYDVKHEDTYLIQNETKEDAIYNAENQNISPKYNCKCIDEESEIYDVEDSEETTIKEVVWNSKKIDWIDKEEKEKQKAIEKAKKEDLISRGLCLKCGEYIKHDERNMNYRGYCPDC